MKVVCPQCKSRSIIDKGMSSGKMNLECNDCNKSFSRIMPDKITNPVKELYAPPPVPQPSQQSNVQVGMTWDSPIRSLPMQSGPLSMQYIEALLSQPSNGTSTGWGAPQLTGDGDQVEYIPQDVLIDSAGQLKFTING